MITKDELISVGFYSDNGYEFYDNNGPQSMYNVKSQSLYEHCEVDGVGEKLVVITNIDELVEIYYTYFRENI